MPGESKIQNRQSKIEPWCRSFLHADLAQKPLIFECFYDAAIEEFLDRKDTGLEAPQIKAGRHLVKLMSQFAAQTPEHIEPAELIDDPRWRKIREAAARFHTLLKT